MRDRHALYAGRVTDLTIDGFHGAASGSTLATIGLEDVRRFFLRGAWPPISLGLSGVPESEIVVDSPNRVTKGGVHVHLPR